MKRLALVAAVLVLAACSSKKDETATADTAAPAMAPAPMDTGMKMMDTTASTTPAATTTTTTTTKTTTKKKK
jgi:ABC-type glycerol-3-phosphate transport system substrate-binding protein